MIGRNERGDITFENFVGQLGMFLLPVKAPAKPKLLRVSFYKLFELVGLQILKSELPESSFTIPEAKRRRQSPQHHDTTQTHQPVKRFPRQT